MWSNFSLCSGNVEQSFSVLEMWSNFSLSLGNVEQSPSLYVGNVEQSLYVGNVEQSPSLCGQCGAVALSVRAMWSSRPLCAGNVEQIDGELVQWAT